MKKISEINTFLVIALIVLFSVTAYAAQFILGENGTEPVATTAAPVFTRDLSEGASGADVWALNQILDIEFNTTIANPSVFSATTEADLVKLQERYAAEILTPSGLTVGTGTVGTATITELNVLAQKYGIALAQYPAPVVVASPVIPQIFTETLSLGSTGSDVTLLKTVLNSDPSTALVYTNASEEQDPTDLFDTATQIAVEKFQEKYSSEILTPNGLTTGTGVVGPATEKELNEILATFSSSTAVETLAENSNIVTPTSVNQINNPNSVTNSCTSDTYSCNGWSPCVNGTQTQICQITYACQNPNANHSFTPSTQSCSAPIAAPIAPAAPGSTVATGFVDECNAGNAANCTITSGSATCNNNYQIVCPSGSYYTQTGSTNVSTSSSSLGSACAASPNIFGNSLSLPITVNRTSYSCVVPSTPAGTVVASGEFQTCLGGAQGDITNGIPNTACNVTSGYPNACGNSVITCPSGTTAEVTNTWTNSGSTNWCPAPSLSISFPGELVNAFSCVTVNGQSSTPAVTVTGESSTPSPAAPAPTTSTSCNGDIICTVGSVIGGAVNGILSIIHL